MPKNYLDDTPYEEHLFSGKLVTGRRPFLAGKENFISLRNMRYSPGGIGIETRYGMRRFNNTAVASGGDIEKLWQHLYTFEQTKYQDLYVVSDEKALYKADSIPESSAGSGSLGSSLFSFTANCNIPSFAAVENHAIATSKKDLIAYSGATPYVTSFLFGTDIGLGQTAGDEDDKTFQIATDEVTNNNSDRLANITLTNSQDALYYGFWQPVDGLVHDLGSNVNSTASFLNVEYWSGSKWTLLKPASWWANTTYLDDDCSSLDDWDDDDAGSGSASTQTTSSGREVFRIYSGDAGAANYAQISQDVGTLGDNVAITLLCYHDDIGTNANADFFYIEVDHADVSLRIRICTDGVYVYDGAAWNQTALTSVSEDKWMLWTFVADFSTPASATVDGYRNGTSIFSDVDCSHTGSFTSGDIILKSLGSNTANQLTFVSHIVVGTALDTTGHGFSDGTASSGAPFAQDGTISWTIPAVGTEQPRRINGLTLFWYKLYPNDTLEDVDFVKMTVTKDWREIEDLTDGLPVLPSGFIWMDNGDDPYIDLLDRVLVDSKGTYALFEDATTDEDIAAADEIYVGFPIRVMGFRLDFIEGYNNDGGVSTLTVSYWAGTSWTAYAADEMDDGTSKNSKTFNQNGEIRLENKGTSVKPTTLPAGGIKLPMFWYKLTFSAKLYNDGNDEIRLWKVRGIPAPKTQNEISHCNWVENFKDRLFRFGLEDAPNTAEFSAYKNPFALTGDDTSAVWPRTSFGNTDEVVCAVWPRITFGNRDEVVCAVRFFNEMIVFKRNEVWMMEGDSPETFGTLLLDDTLGCVAPESAKLVRTWVTLPDGRTDFRHAIFFASHDGVYGVDGVKCWKISTDIDNYFNSKYSSTCIKSNYRQYSSAWFDPLENEYHLTIWSGSTPTLLEFVYNCEFQKWAGPFVRLTVCECGVSVFDSNHERLQYGGGTDGRVYRLEYGSNDVYTNGVAGAIDNWVEMGDHWTGLLAKYAHRGVFLFGYAQTSGSSTVTMKGDGKSSGVTIGTISMVRSGYSTFIGKLSIGDEDSSGTAMENKFHAARLKFATNNAGVRQELYGFLVKKRDVTEAPV